ncbi:hypothetical protein PF010_g22695 [Phytophthora fragariae]|uniref:Secreted protein n=1 Tax=Phytophthora fragariae TaxID=53985 RepID=A0A6G0MNW7_9STRA|nr:hypothetical protein PF010_g22695 [Phytophthora fragariae]KAE9174890.1 hypothetical protein PF004_g26539 [Phytophthora fragariae]
MTLFLPLRDFVAIPALAGLCRYACPRGTSFNVPSCQTRVAGVETTTSPLESTEAKRRNTWCPRRFIACLCSRALIRD